VLLLLVAAGAVTYAIWQLQADARRDAFEETGNLAGVMAGQLSYLFQSIDRVLAETRDRVEEIDSSVRPIWQRALASPASYDKLKQNLARVPQAFNMAIADVDGNVVVSTAGWPAPTINISDRHYFQIARDRNNNQLTIVGPIVNRINGKSAIIFARGMKGGTDEFIGVVYLSVDLASFEVIYDAVKSIRHLTFSLILNDGTILVRHPSENSRGGLKVAAGSPWYQAINDGGGKYQSIGDFDGRARLVSVRPLQGFPASVSVSTLEDSALAPWRTRALVLGFASFILIGCSAYLLIAVWKKVQSLRASEHALLQQSGALKQTNIRFDAALNNMSQGLCMFDAERRLVVANAKFRELYGLDPEQARQGTTEQQLLEYRSQVDRVGAVATRDSRLNRKGQRELEKLSNGRVISISRQPMADRGLVVTFEDITDRYQQEARVAFLARHDVLTGLENRAAFLESLEEAAARLKRHGEAFSVFMLDLDHFKQVNDSLGHAAGDSLLREAAERLQRSLRDTDRLARLGGDEFAIIQSCVTDQQQNAVSLATRIINAITEPYGIEGTKVTIGTSIGIAFAPSDSSEPKELLKLADVALYRAKAHGRNGFTCFHPDMLADLRARHSLEEELREAISRNEFELHYQPIVDVRTYKPTGAEALLRWRHPERGLLLPDQFIPLAEETGLISAIGEWVLQQACADAAGWPSYLSVAVNLSAVQFKKDNLIDVILCALVDSGLAPERLEVEITETALMTSDANYLSLMHRLKNLGVLITVDDFGTGYSSLSYLTMFPFDRIKIDRSFVQNLTKRADCAAIISAVLALGAGLDMKTVAEGVETQQQLQLLRSAGVDFVQGYMFGRPCPVADLILDQVCASPALQPSAENGEAQPAQASIEATL
jgi:diguanylate cyclase (GGDEF)-like protein/PAS domain S-box-containing protein